VSEYLTLVEVADRLRVGKRTVERLIAEGELESSKIRGRRLIPASALERYARRAEKRGRVA
jgi:excisionase family DNA binding protein